MNIKIIPLILVISSLLACRQGGAGPKGRTGLPALTMRLVDTTILLNTDQIKTGMPLVIIYFSPDCSHCREETRQLVSHIDQFKNVRFLFLTPMSYDDLIYFYKEFKLDRYPNITVGQDNHLSFYHYFNPKGIPYTAVYDNDKKLKQIFVGFDGVDNILESIRS
jgi:hypothetical protein